MLQPTSNEACAACPQAYCVEFSVPLHDGSQTPLYGNGPHQTTATSSIPIYSQNDAAYLQCVTENAKCVDGACATDVNSRMQVDSEPPHQYEQPSFMRRPYRYKKRNAKSKASSKPAEALRLEVSPSEEGFPWDTCISTSASEFITPRDPMNHACPAEIEANQYTSLYHDPTVAFAVEPYSTDMAAMPPRVLSPPAGDVRKVMPRPKPIQTSHGGGGMSFLPSPDSSCSSPKLGMCEWANPKEKREPPRSGRVQKPKPRRATNQVVSGDRKPPTYTVNLTLDEERSFEDIFQRQFDTMCRAVISDFNSTHKTQIGSDLVLQLLQQMDLKSLAPT